MSRFDDLWHLDAREPYPDQALEDYYAPQGQYPPRRRLRPGLRFAYADGGEMRCGVCGGVCWQHWRDEFGRNDIGSCCAFETPRH